MTRCGFIALIGAPNAGKSTLLNALVGTKLSIVSPKVQTTRTRILGITTEGDSQMLFVDTPGIFAPKRRLDRAMVAAAWTGAGDADVIVLLIDATLRVSGDTHHILNQMKESGRKCIVALTKIDLVKKDELIPFAQYIHDSGVASDIFMISSVTGDGLDLLKSHLVSVLPESPFLYPVDELSDQPWRRIAAEVTREQLYLQLEQELPYASTVETELWEEFDNGSVKISQAIFVMRDNQKAIVLGKGGSRIKSIGEAARKELEGLMGRRVHLTLFVKVRENWGDDAERYREMGLDFNA